MTEKKCQVVQFGQTGGLAVGKCWQEMRAGWAYLFIPSTVLRLAPCSHGASILAGETVKNQANKHIRVISGKQRITAGRHVDE